MSERKRRTPAADRKDKAFRSLPSSSASDPFILSTDPASIKPNATSRSFIRRHVMKGKNRKSNASEDLTLRSWINHKHGAVPDTSPLQGPLNTRVGPQIDGSAFCGMEFAVDMEPYMLRDVYDFINVTKKAMFPIERCVDMGRVKQHWLEDLSRDPAYVHTVLYVAQAYFAFVKSQTSLSPMAIMHMNKTMIILRNKLAEANPVLTDSTIYTVLALASVSEALDDLDTAKQHLNGLHQLIRLRGGISALAQKPSLQIKCCRLDLRLALKLGSKPLFIPDDSLSWEPYLVDPRKASTTTPVQTFCAAPDIRLVNVWRDLREFAMAINLAHQTQRKLSPSLFQEALISVQYRLQHLAYDGLDKHEILRVALLAFSASIFLEIHAASVPLRHLAGQLRTLLQSVQQETNTEWQKLILWLTYVGRISVLDCPEDLGWLKEQSLNATRAIGPKSWVETRQILKSLVWVDVVHDEAGKRFFDDVMTSQNADGDRVET